MPIADALGYSEMTFLVFVSQFINLQLFHLMSRQSCPRFQRRGLARLQNLVHSQSETRTMSILHIDWPFQTWTNERISRTCLFCIQSYFFVFYLRVRFILPRIYPDISSWQMLFLEHCSLYILALTV